MQDATYCGSDVYATFQVHFAREIHFICKVDADFPLCKIIKNVCHWHKPMAANLCGYRKQIATYGHSTFCGRYCTSVTLKTCAQCVGHHQTFCYTKTSCNKQRAQTPLPMPTALHICRPCQNLYKTAQDLLQNHNHTQTSCTAPQRALNYRIFCPTGKRFFCRGTLFFVFFCFLIFTQEGGPLPTGPPSAMKAKKDSMGNGDSRPAKGGDFSCGLKKAV